MRAADIHEIGSKDEEWDRKQDVTVEKTVQDLLRGCSKVETR